VAGRRLEPYHRGVPGWTDIAREGWVTRLPRAARPYAVLGRFDRPIGAWLLFLPGLWSILLARPTAPESVRLILLFGLGALVMRAAGCVVNDMWDRDMDRQVTRTAARPLASGELRMRQAGAFLAALLLIGLAILLQLNRLAQGLGVASLLLVALYPLAKRVTWWPQAVLGLTFSWGAPMGYAAASGRLDGAALALYAAAFFWILGYDTIYAHQDREDDALVGVRSTARLFADRTAPFLACCYTATLLLLALAGGLAGLAWPFFAGLLLPAGLLAWQAATLDIDDPAGCLHRFKLNRETGLLIGLAILLGRL
jgi:4-hydroxybenzoate polyprenyltransferase